MDERAVRGAVMETGLEGKKVKVRCGRGNIKERQSQVNRKKEGRTKLLTLKGNKHKKINWMKKTVSFRIGRAPVDWIKP